MEDKINKHLIFFETYDRDCVSWGLKEDEDPHTLYVGIKRTGDLFWYDNINGEWCKSMWHIGHLLGDKHFKQVTKFDNGYISTDDAIQYFMSKPHTVGACAIFDL